MSSNCSKQPEPASPDSSKATLVLNLPQIYPVPNGLQSCELPQPGRSFRLIVTVFDGNGIVWYPPGTSSDQEFSVSSTSNNTAIPDVLVPSSGSYAFQCIVADLKCDQCCYELCKSDGKGVPYFTANAVNGSGSSPNTFNVKFRLTTCSCSC